MKTHKKGLRTLRTLTKQKIAQNKNISFLSRNKHLVRKVIVNKLGFKQTVWINPDETEYFYEKVRGGFRRAKVTNKGRVITEADEQQKFNEKYPFTAELMKSKNKWKKEGDKWKVKLTETEWQKLIREHEPFIHSVAKKWAYGYSSGERYKDLRAVAQFGFTEGVNNFGKYIINGKPTRKFSTVFAYVVGRIKESLANKLQTGLRIPQGLQEPYRQFKDVKEQLRKKFGHEPSRQLVAKLLQNKYWNKKTFYPQYELAEQRKYGDVDKIRGGNKRFSDLTEKQKRIEKQKDILPIKGWISVNKTAVGEDKEQKHLENLENIKQEYRENLVSLKLDYMKDKRRSKKSLQEQREELEGLQNDLDNLIKQKDKRGEALSNRLTMLEELKRKASGTPKFAEVSSEKFEEKFIKNEHEDFYAIVEIVNEAKKDIERWKNVHKPIDADEYLKKKKEIILKYSNERQAETKRYNKDISATRLAGVEERIREFEEIESAKEIPLNIQAPGEEEGLSNTEVVSAQSSLSPEELAEYTDTNLKTKETLKDIATFMLPAHRDVFLLKIGLHPDSVPTADKVWGELKGDKEIVRHLERQHKIVLNNQDKLFERIKDKTNTKAFHILSVVPFVVPQYVGDVKSLVRDTLAWKKKKPNAKKFKLKMDRSSYKKAKSEWNKRVRISRNVWKKWRAKHRDLSQSKSVKKYVEIRTKMRALKQHRPKKFIYKNKPVTKEQIQHWQKRKPKLFYESQSGKEKWIRDSLKTSYEILNRMMPKQQMQDWYYAHDKLIQSGVTVEKAMQENGEESSKMLNLLKLKRCFDEAFSMDLKQPVLYIKEN